ncbi:MAG: sigma 54-interacting transcriptional regulator [Enhygromyxa sp.]
MRRLGDGAEGGTWIANDTGGRSVVLKHIPPDRRSTVARAFELLRSVSSPHLPAALELIEDGQGGVWLVTGYVEGRPLGPGPVPLEQALSEALGVAHALAAIHGLGTHHGDVSANNVIITPTRGVVLTDLGQLGSHGCGTPGFLAPEVLAGKGGPSADRFGVGSLLCLRLLGQVPWRRPEALLALERAAVRRRLLALAEAAEVECPDSVLALLERLLDPEPEQRVADPTLLVARLRVLHRASAAGEALRTRAAWWLPLPNGWSYVGSLDELRDAVRSLESGRLRLLAVAGPLGSGRGRIIEEIVASLQLARARRSGDGSEQGIVARRSDPETLARDLGGAGEWLDAWVGDGRTRPIASRAWGCVEAPSWPSRVHDSVELQAAVLQAGASLGDDALILPVEPALGRALAGQGSELRVIELRRWGLDEVRRCLLEVIDDRPTDADLERWSAAIHEASGGWPAKVIRAIEAYARTGGDDPDRAAIERALIASNNEARLDPQTARRVLDRRWGLPAELPPSLQGDGQPLASAVAAARLALHDALATLARATLEQLRKEGRPVCLALALDADDADAIEVASLDPAAELSSDLFEWLEQGGIVRVGPRLRLAALRELIRRGQTERALSLLETIATTGSPSPAEELEGVRALEQLGRASEALTALDRLLPRAAGPDHARALGLRWRALVDLGEAARARAEAEAWARELEASPRPAPSWRRAVAWLWGGLALLYAGGEAQPWLERALDECAGEHGPATQKTIASLRARVYQLEANLAQLAGDGERARERYRAAAASFAEAGERLGQILVEGSLASLALESGEYQEALTRGRRALHGFLARAQVQTLPAACFNLIRALVAVGAVDEGRRLHALVRAMILAAASSGEPGELARARLRRAELELDAAEVPGDPQVRDAWRRELAGRLIDCALALAEVGASNEAADARLAAAAMLRVAGRSEAAARQLAAARELAGPSCGRAEAEPELALALGLALETLAQARDAEELGEAVAALAELPTPTELVALGQRLLAWNYDRSLLVALHRCEVIGDPSSIPVARRLLRNLEDIMTKAPPLDRRSLRQSLLSEAGEAAPLRELVRELEVAEHEPPPSVEPKLASGPTSAGASTPTRAGPTSAGDNNREVARLQQLLRLFRRLARTDELEQLLEHIVEAMMDLTDAERGVVCVGQGEERIEVAREFAAAGEGVSFSRSVIDRVLQGGEPVLSVDATSDDRFDGSRSISHLNLRSVLAVPLVFRGELLGAAYVDHRLRRGNFDATDLAHMEDFADLAALAVAQTRALAAVRSQAAELERQRAELAELLDRREAALVNLREEVRSGPERRFYRGMVGSSAAMQRVFRLVDRLADSEVPVVIYGESGTGKELVARAIHEAGGRADKPFVAENCGAIPETLLESVLFGHARGAFTGAQTARPGLFEAADGGTIFLDEIGETSPAMQTKLLRVLQEGEVRRIGETKPRKVSVRVIAASNRDLEAMVEAGSFRQDLFYRINVVKLEIPALRDRREDIPALIEHFLSRHRREGDPPLEISASALRKLTRYPWPGNVRELENEVQRWLALCEDRVMPDDLSPAIEGSLADIEDPDDLELRPRVDRLERELIARAMARTGGNQTQAAQLLGLSRYGLQKKLKRLEETA